jgi:hypothetical protein
MRIRSLASIFILGVAAASQSQVIIPAAQPVTLLTNPADYGYTPNAFQETDDKIRAWNEQSDYTLTSDLTVDITNPGLYDSNKDLDKHSSIAAGTEISSEYLYFDPKHSGHVKATVDFGTDILGIIVYSGDDKSNDHLLASDYLIPSGVESSRVPTGHFNNRGLELSGPDSITLINATSLSLDLSASSPGDQIRVITAAQAVPEPSALAILGIGAFGIFLRKRN